MRDRTVEHFPDLLVLRVAELGHRGVGVHNLPSRRRPRSALLVELDRLLQVPLQDDAVALRLELEQPLAQRPQYLGTHGRPSALQLRPDPLQEEPSHLLLPGGPQGEGLLELDPRHVGGAQLQLLETLQPVQGELVESVGPAGLGVLERVLDEVGPARLAAEREEGAALRPDRLDEGGKVGLPDRVVVPRDKTFKIS